MAEELPKIQIKGMASDIAKFRSDFQKTRDSMQQLRDAHTGLGKDISDAAQQLTQMREDLRFEMEQLGNGGGNSETEKEVITSKDVGDAAPLVTDPAASTGSGSQSDA